MGFVSLRDLLDDRGLVFDLVDDVFGSSSLIVAHLRYHVRFHVSAPAVQTRRADGLAGSPRRQAHHPRLSDSTRRLPPGEAAMKSEQHA